MTDLYTTATIFETIFGEPDANSNDKDLVPEMVG